MKFTKSRWIALLLALVLILTLVACGEKSDPDATDGGAEQGESNDSQGAAFSITYNGVRLTLGAEAKTALDRLGEPTAEPQEVFDCGAGNSRVYYRYSSLELYVMKSVDGSTVIDQIEINDDLPQTDKGFCIGSSADEVRAAYGTPAKDEDGELRYTSGNQSLIFNIKDGKVSDIGLLRVTQ